MIRKDEGDLAGARLAYSEAVAIFEKSRSPGVSYNVWNLLMLLGSAEEQSGHLGEAQNWLGRAMEYSQKPGEEIFFIANAGRLTKVLQSQTNLEGAESVLRKALATLEQEGAFTKRATANGCANLWTKLGDLCVTRTNLNGAEEAYGRALDLEQQPFVYGVQAIPRLLGKISAVHQSKGDFRKAEADLLEAKKYVAPPDARPDSKADIFTRLADLYAAWGKREEEAKWRNIVAELKLRERSKKEDEKVGGNQP